MRLYKQNKLLDLTTIHQIKLNLIASDVVFFVRVLLHVRIISLILSSQSLCGSKMVDPEKNHLTIRKQN